MDKNVKKFFVFNMILAFGLTIFCIFVVCKLNKIESFLELKNPKGVELPYHGSGPPFYPKKKLFVTVY
jgi:hypothetical protein